jgi:hypothetical protein
MIYRPGVPAEEATAKDSYATHRRHQRRILHAIQHIECGDTDGVDFRNIQLAGRSSYLDACCSTGKKFAVWIVVVLAAAFAAPLRFRGSRASDVEPAFVLSRHNDFELHIKIILGPLFADDL